jgi:hypothetical protein
MPIIFFSILRFFFHSYLKIHYQNYQDKPLSRDPFPYLNILEVWDIIE